MKKLCLLIGLCFLSLEASVSVGDLLEKEHDLQIREDVRAQWMEFPDGRLYRRRRGFDFFSIIDEQDPIYPRQVIFPIDTTEEDLSCCIITYASNNRNREGDAEKKILRMKASLEKVGFKGHLLYRIGGWPNMEEGCLAHCHVPYGFKVCAFLEALRLGYKKAIWLDVSIIALKPLDSLFQWIQEKNCLYRFAYNPLDRYAHDLFLQAMNISLEELSDIPHISACVVGLNLEDQNVRNFLQAWHQSVLEEDAYFSFYPEQLPMSVLMKRYGLTQGIYSDPFVKMKEEEIEKCCFYNLKR